MDSLSKRILAGAVSGFAATAPMSAVMLVMHRWLPWHQQEPLPPKQITANALEAASLDDELTRPQMKALSAVNHFGYGAAMGSLYGALTSSGQPSSPLACGISYGLGVWGISYLGLLPSIGLYRAATWEQSERNWLMLAAHVVWGGGLGVLTEIGSQQRRHGDAT